MNISFLKMDHENTTDQENAQRRYSLKKGLTLALAPLPLPLVNLVFGKLVRVISQDRPEIFQRLAGHHHKKFLIDATNLPFVICLRPDPLQPELMAFRRRKAPQTCAKITGSFLTLLGMIDGRYDGDALFFTRHLRVEGDTEAVVCLRNALDDVEGSVTNDIAAFFGLPGRKFLKIARRIEIHA